MFAAVIEVNITEITYTIQIKHQISIKNKIKIDEH